MMEININTTEGLSKSSTLTRETTLLLTQSSLHIFIPVYSLSPVLIPAVEHFLLIFLGDSTVQ